jgi:hypothetical protein
MPRTLLRPALACAGLVIALAACSGSDDSSDGGGAGGGAGSGGGGGDTSTVSSSGLSFDVPSNYSDVDTDDLKDNTDDGSRYDEVTESLGITTEQFEQYLETVDLFLFSDEESAGGFVDNINVIRQEGDLPDDATLEQQFAAIGAKVADVAHTDSDLGDIADLTYTLSVQDADVAGRAILVPTDGGVVSITVSAVGRDAADEIGDRIVDTLAEDS